MSLKFFHIVFVTCSSLLSFGFGGWSLAQGGGYIVVGILAFLFGIVMVVYGFWFWRKITTPEEERRRRRKLFRTVSTLSLFLLLLGSRGAWACSVCFGEAEGSMIDAAKVGVFLLYGLVLLVQVGLAAFFLYLRRQSIRYNGQVQPWWTDAKESLEP